MEQDDRLGQAARLCQLIPNAASAVDGFEDRLMPRDDCVLSTMMLTANVDEIRVGAEGRAELIAAGFIPSTLQRLKDPSTDTFDVNHACSYPGILPGGGSHNSMRFPSGSITQPNLPNSEVSVLSSTVQPSLRSRS